MGWPECWLLAAHTLNVGDETPLSLGEPAEEMTRRTIQRSVRESNHASSDKDESVSFEQRQNKPLGRLDFDPDFGDDHECDGPIGDASREHR